MISPKYQTYLDHFSRSVPLMEFNAAPESENLIGLRHDVDYDLDLALEMSYWERERDMRATYFLLPTADYWGHDDFWGKALQIQDFGHEVGLHVNILTQWMRGDIDDPARCLGQQTLAMRKAGIRLSGVSAHGDRLCYKKNFLNYWLFDELRPVDPERHEKGRNAEGLQAIHDENSIVYPADHHLTREDGNTFPLWTIPLKIMDLHYDAVHLPCDTYFTDSGGGWKRCPDPLGRDLSRGRHQILIHPEYWRGPRKVYFFLSTARSGSRWLSEVLDRATPLKARHEYILNQNFHRGESAQKATAHFRTIENDPDAIRLHLSQAWEELEGQLQDYAEVNVYLASFTDELRRFFPSGVFVHLHRHPARVVRSLMDRNWYDTPEDHAHPRLRTADAATMNQFERACQYVAEVNERLVEACDHRLALEDLARSPEDLSDSLKRLGIAYYPRLGHELARKVINATLVPEFPSLDDWTPTHKTVFERLAGDVTRALNYPLLSQGAHLRFFHNERLHYVLRRWGHKGKQAVRRLYRSPLGEISIDPARLKTVNCEVSLEREGMIIRPQDNQRHAYLTLGGSGWHALAQEESGKSGWPVVTSNFIRGTFALQFANGGSVTMFAISYGGDDKQLYRRRLGLLDTHHPRLDFAFAPHPAAKAFDIAIYMPAPRESVCVVIQDYKLFYNSQ